MGHTFFFLGGGSYGTKNVCVEGGHLRYKYSQFWTPLGMFLKSFRASKHILLLMEMISIFGKRVLTKICPKHTFSYNKHFAPSNFSVLSTEELFYNNIYKAD